MPGRRKDFDGQYAMIDVGFILHDARCAGLSNTAFRLYITLWCLAVQNRREVLPAHFYPPLERKTSRKSGTHDPQFLASCARVPCQFIASSLRVLCELTASSLRVDCELTASSTADQRKLSLIEVDQDGRIRVCGVRDKHPNLKWKNEDINGFIASYKRGQKEKEKEEEGQKELLPSESLQDSVVEVSEKGSADDKKSDTSPSPEAGKRKLEANGKRKALRAAVDDIYGFYIDTPEFKRTRSQYRLTPLRAGKIQARLKSFSAKDLKDAIFALSKSSFHLGENKDGKRYIEIETHLFGSDERVERWLEQFRALGVNGSESEKEELSETDQRRLFSES